MRRKNLKFTATLYPSKIYLHTILALHTLASTASLCVDVSTPQHLLFLAAIAGSLCYQLNIYTLYARTFQVSLEGSRASIKRAKTARLPLTNTNRTRHIREKDIEEYQGELLAEAWVLPQLIILHLRTDEGVRKSLPIFTDSAEEDDFRRLRIFVLNGPLLHKNNDTKPS